MIKTIEVDRWSKPDAQRRVQHIGMIKAQDAFDQLEQHLKDRGLLPDEYFLFSKQNFNDGMDELPNYDQAVCQVNFGGSEGIYIDITLEVSDGAGRSVQFAAGKTLSEHAEAYQHMSKIAGECSLMLNGRGSGVLEQWEDRKNTELFVSEFGRQIESIGMTFSPSPNKDEYTLTRNGFAVGSYHVKDKELYLKRTTLGDGLTERLRSVFYTTLEYIREYANASPLCASGVSDFRELCSMNGVVLAAKHRGQAGFQFVTWSYSLDGKGVECGHYFEGNYEAAKRDFVKRAELIAPSVVFDEQELAMIRSAISVAGQSDQFVQRLSGEELNRLTELSRRVTDTLSNVDFGGKDVRPTNPTPNEMMMP